MAEVRETVDRAKRRFDLLARFVLVPANSRNEEKKTEDRVAVERDVERLAREIARLVNEAPATEREELRAYAVGLVREEIRGTEEVGDAGVEEPRPPVGFNPIGMAIPVVMVGAFLFFLFPPVGLLLFAVAGFLVIWGILATLFSGRRVRRG